MTAHAINLIQGGIETLVWVCDEDGTAMLHRSVASDSGYLVFEIVCPTCGYVAEEAKGRVIP